MKWIVGLVGPIFLAAPGASGVFEPDTPHFLEDHKTLDPIALYVAQGATATTRDGFEDSVEAARADEKHTSKNCEHVVTLEKPKRLHSLFRGDSQDKKLEPGGKHPLSSFLS